MNFQPIQIAAAPASASSSPSSSSSSNALSGWSYSPNALNLGYALGSTPTLTVLEVTPSDYASSSLYAGLSNFRAEISIINSGTWLNFLTTGNTEEFQEFNTPNFDLLLSIVNTNTLTAVNYSAQIKFDVLADNSQGQTVFIESKFKQFNLLVSEAPQLEVSDNNFSINTILNSAGTGLFSVDIESNESWNIYGVTTGLNVSTTSGTGNTTVYFSVQNSYVFSSVGSVVFGFNINCGGLTETINLTVTVEDTQTNASITELNITQVLGDPPTLGSFDIQTNQSFTITKPSWLQLNTTNGSASSTIEWGVQTASSTGVQAGDLIITFGSESITIPVTFQVVDFVNSSELDNEVNYTRENNMIYFTRDLDLNSFIRLEIDIESRYANDGGSLIEIENSIQDIGFPSDLAEFNLGEYCDNLLPTWNHPINILEDFPEDWEGVAIHLILAHVLASKIDFNGNVIVNPVDLGSFNFIRGNNKRGLLNVVEGNSSVVNGGFAIVHLLLKDSTPFSWRTGGQIYRSGNISQSSQQRIISFIHKVDTVHKYITFRYGATNIERRFYIRPDVTDAVTVFFPNQHGLPEALSFGGGISVENNFNYRENSSYINFTTKTESLNFDENVIIELSTGGLFPEDRPKLLELMKVKRATLYYKEKEYFINPVQQKIVSLNSERNIDAFKVKFNMSKRDYDTIV